MCLLGPQLWSDPSVKNAGAGRTQMQKLKFKRFIPKKKNQNHSNVGEKLTTKELEKWTWKLTKLNNAKLEREQREKQQGVYGENDGENKGEYNDEHLTKNENKPGD